MDRKYQKLADKLAEERKRAENYKEAYHCERLQRKDYERRLRGRRGENHNQRSRGQDDETADELNTHNGNLDDDGHEQIQLLPRSSQQKRTVGNQNQNRVSHQGKKLVVRKSEKTRPKNEAFM